MHITNPWKTVSIHIQNVGYCRHCDVNNTHKVKVCDTEHPNNIYSYSESCHEQHTINTRFGYSRYDISSHQHIKRGFDYWRHGVP